MTESTLLPRSSDAVDENTSRRADAEAGFEAVYAEFFDFVWRTALGLGVHPNDVEDVAQEVFVVVHKKLAQFEGRSRLRTWLTGITINSVREYRYARRHAATTTVIDEALPYRAEPADVVGERNEAGRLLCAILDRLSEEQRTVFVLTEIDEMSAKEIAEALSINMNTVYSRLRLARGEVERHLNRLRITEKSEAR